MRRHFSTLTWPLALYICGIAVAGGLAACGSGSGSGSDPKGGAKPVPVATAVGTINGTATSATVGAGGGTVATADGKVKLTFPAGALTADTTISIQPLTNNAPGGIGAAYRLEPSGQTFAQPVTLTFAYADTDFAGSAPEVSSVAFQTADGYWQWMDNPVLDTTAKTVSVQTTHFSDWSHVRGFQLRPPSATVKVGQSQQLKVAYCYPSMIAGTDIDLAYLNLAYECDPNKGEGAAPLIPLSAINSWMVNGTAGGDATYGTISGDKDGGIYVAPANKPTPNIVSVSADLATKARGKVLIVSSITIMDADRSIHVRYAGGSTLLLSPPYSTMWGGNDDFTLTYPKEGLTGDFGNGGADGPIPASLNLQNGTTSDVHVSGTCSNLPPILTGAYEIMTVDRVQATYMADTLVSFTFSGIQHIPGVTVPDAPCTDYYYSYPGYDASTAVIFSLTGTEWTDSATRTVTVYSKSPGWSLEIGPQ